MGTRQAHVLHMKMLSGLIGLNLAEELLIDFRELIGEHSGENLAHAVYETQEAYGLKGRASIFSLIFRALADEFRRLLQSIVTMPRTMILWRNVWKFFTMMMALSFVQKRLDFAVCHTRCILLPWRYYI